MSEKLRIRGDGIDIRAQFNPTRLKISKSVLNRKVENKQENAQRLQFIRGDNQSLSFELLFDATLEDVDVERITGSLLDLTLIVPGEDRPPIVEITWGTTLGLRGVASKVDRTFDLFDESGRPLRATVDLSFEEVLDEAQRTAKKAGQCSPHTRRWEVQSGETLSGIAAAAYRDPALWRVIADANRAALPDPLYPIPGTVLMIPPAGGEASS